MAPAVAKKEKDVATKESRLKMEIGVVQKVIREVKKKEERNLVATDVARVVTTLASKNDGWLNKSWSLGRRTNSSISINSCQGAVRRCPI